MPVIDFAMLFFYTILMTYQADFVLFPCQGSWVKHFRNADYYETRLIEGSLVDIRVMAAEMFQFVA